MKTAFTVYTLPAHWACALVNDDRTGLDDAEEFALDEWLESEAPGYCVGASDTPEFCRSNDAGTLAGDCLDFTFQKA